MKNLIFVVATLVGTSHLFCEPVWAAQESSPQPPQPAANQEAAQQNNAADLRQLVLTTRAKMVVIESIQSDWKKSIGIVEQVAQVIVNEHNEGKKAAAGITAFSQELDEMIKLKNRFSNELDSLDAAIAAIDWQGQYAQNQRALEIKNNLVQSLAPIKQYRDNMAQIITSLQQTRDKFLDVEKTL